MVNYGLLWLINDLSMDLSSCVAFKTCVFFGCYENRLMYYKYREYRNRLVLQSENIVLL